MTWRSLLSRGNKSGASTEAGTAAAALRSAPRRPRADPHGGDDSAPANMTDELLVAEDSLVDTIALTPSGGLMADPFLAGTRPHAGALPETAGADDAVTGSGTEKDESFVGGVLQAGPLAVGGLVANGLNILATVLVARLLTTQQYGGVAQLLGLFFVLSMPGSALLVGVVRRIAAATAQGRQEEMHRWTTRMARRCLIGLAVWVVISVAIAEPLGSALRLPALGRGGVRTDCRRRVVGALPLPGRPPGTPPLLQASDSTWSCEIAVRVVFVLGLAAAGFGITGFAVGLLLGETGGGRCTPATWPPEPGTTRPPTPWPSDLDARNRTLSIDMSAALIGFALLGVLQNADIILVGRLDPSSSGPYAAISVASKSLVFGAILLGSYVLPEAALRWHQGQHALRQVAVTLVFLLVPALVLLGVALVAPEWFLTTFFSAKLNGAAPAFSTLVGAMACLGTVVILTNYLFGAARRWIVGLLAVGVVVLLILIHKAHGAIVATARAELAVQGGLALAVAVAFAVVHLHWWRENRSTVPEDDLSSIGRRDLGGPV